jgi:hypothetical protein
MKICGKCNIEKPLEDFIFRKDTNHYESRCNKCVKEYQREYYLKNKQKMLKSSNSYYNENVEKVLLSAKEYREQNKEKIKKRKSDYHIKNAEKIREKTKNWRENNKNWRVQYEKDRRNNDTVYALRVSVRNRIKTYLKKCNINKKNNTFDIVGCSPEFLKEYLEKQFKDGMSWEKRNEWHIDHIIPLSSAKTKEEIYKLSHYTNLQPLWAEDNLKKSNKIINKNKLWQSAHTEQ